MTPILGFPFSLRVADVLSMYEEKLKTPFGFNFNILIWHGSLLNELKIDTIGTIGEKDGADIYFLIFI